MFLQGWTGMSEGLLLVEQPKGNTENQLRFKKRTNLHIQLNEKKRKAY